MCNFIPSQVKLKDSLMSSISFSQAKDAELAWLDGLIHINPAANLGQHTSGGNENEDARELNLVPILDALPSVEVSLGIPRLWVALWCFTGCHVRER